MNKVSDNTIMQFLLQQYPDEQTAIDYLTNKRWGGKVICPYCKGSRVGKGSLSQPHRCYPCNKKFSVKTGTFMHSSPLPAREWLLMMFFMAKSRTGASSLWLSDQLGITQKSTWYMGHRIRQACSQRYGNMIGTVEVDETYIGGKEANKHAKDRRKAGREPVGKTIVIGAKERGGQIMAKVVKNTKQQTLQGFITNNVLKGSRVITDEHRSYIGLDKQGYQHKSVSYSRGEYVRGDMHTNSIESFWALVKRAIKGTYSRVSSRYLQRYLDKITARESSNDFISAVCQSSEAR